MTSRNATRVLFLASALSWTLFGQAPERASAQQGLGPAEDAIGKAVMGSEKEVWEAVKQKNVARFNQLVADDARSSSTREF